MLYIEKNFLVGQGTNRACYVHPNDPDKCVKVTISDDHKESRRETSYYRFLQKRGIKWDMLARFYGIEKTDLGDGIICDMPRDFDGEISKTLYHYLSDTARTQEILNPLPLLFKLRDYILNERIIVKDLNFRNILYQKISSKETNLVIIDGIGNHELIPFSTYIGYFTLRRIHKKWDEFEQSWRRKHQDNLVFIQMLDQSADYRY